MNLYDQIILEFVKNEEIITFDDIKFSEEVDVNPDKLLKKLLADNRFLKLGDENKYGNLQFLKKELLLHKLIYLNIELGRNCLNKISYKDFYLYFFSLIPKEIGKEDLELIIYFAGKFSLVFKSQNNFLFFPYSILIYKIYSYLNRYIYIIYDNNLNIIDKDFSIINKLESLFDNFCNTYFDEKRLNIIFSERIAAKERKGKTLEELGREFGITRERVRQIESKFNGKLIFKHLSYFFKSIDYGSEINIKNNKFKSLIKLFEILILLLISLKGSKIIKKKYFLITNRIKFILKILNINFIDNYFKNYYFIALDKEVLNECINIIKLNKVFLFKEAYKLLSEKLWENLIESDINKLIKSILENYKINITGLDAAYIALKSIGGVAHYSQISKKCIELFEDGEKFSPRNVLAYLNREPQRRDSSLPWVWVGSRGVYALKELGYSRPEDILFVEVADVVEKEFDITNKPVSFTKIKAEMVKRRKFIIESSLIFACTFNERIKYLNKIKCCVPIKYADRFGVSENIEVSTTENEMADEDFIDDILSKYEN